MRDAEIIARIRLLQTRNIGPMTYSLLLDRYGNAVKALAAVPDLASRGGRKLTVASAAIAKAEIAANAAIGATMLWRGSDLYPDRLAQFSDAPAVMSAIGNLHLLQKPMIAIVGARNASINAMHFAETLAADLGRARFVIVSGMAHGIDSAAHPGAMVSGTIGVLAGGADIIYPPENRDLFARIKTDGLLLAEMPPGTAPTPRHFPTRNRIIASLPTCVIAIEAAAQSGSVITNREAADRGTDVMAVPGAPLDPRAIGCNRLIRDGAILVTTAEDVIEHVNRDTSVRLPPPIIRWHESAATPATEADIDRCRTMILDGLSGEPTDIDAVITWCDLPVPAVMAAVLELELAGIVQRHFGNRVSRCMTGL